MSHSPESFNSEDYNPEDTSNEADVSDVTPETTSPDEADMPSGEVPNNELETTNELEETSPEKQSTLEDPPEGYKNANDIAKDNKVSYDTVKNIAKKLGIDGKKFRDKTGKAATFYSPEDVEEIINSDEIQKLLALEEAPEGYKNASNIAEDESLKNKVNYNIVINVAKKLGIAGKEYRGKNGKGTIFYSPEEVERIIKSDEMQKLLTLGGAPEGYKTRDDIATSEPLKDKVSARTVAIIAANKLGIDGKEYRCKNGIGKVAIFYSPEEVERIINSDEIQKLLALEEAPEGYKTGENIVTDELPNSKVSATTIRRVAKKLGINGKKYRNKMGRETNYYSPEEVERIIKSDEIQKLLALEEVPEGYKTASNIATDEPLNGKVRKGTVERVAKKLGIDGKEYRDERGHAATFYSPEEVERIINSEKMQKLLALEEAPEGYKTAGDIVTDEPLNSKVSAPTVTGMAKNLGVTGKEYRGKNGQAATFYSPEEVERIIKSDEMQKLLALEEAPEGYKTAGDIAAGEPINNKVSGSTITKIADKEPGVNGKEYRRKRQVGIFYSPEEVESIISSDEIQKLLALEDPPEGYKTTGDIAKENKVCYDTVANIAKNLGIKGKEYRKKGQAATFYSLEEQLDIIEAVEKTIPRTSFPEKAFAFYLKQTGKNIKDNIRPDWMKNPNTNRNLEIDVYIENDNPPPPGFGIEYDGVNFHGEDKVERDSLKNRLARNNGVEIIHIRENGCPELPDDIPCITRKDDNHTNKGLKECIEQCFAMLSIPLPETGIDITRDQSEIFALVAQEFDIVEEKKKKTSKTKTAA